MTAREAAIAECVRIAESEARRLVLQEQQAGFAPETASLALHQYQCEVVVDALRALLSEPADEPRDTDLGTLLTRVGLATGPDRQLDHDLVRVLNLPLGRSWYITTFVDEALAALDCALPGYTGTLVLDPPSAWVRRSTAAEAAYYRKTGYFPPQTYRHNQPLEAATPALAIVASMLETIIAENPTV